MGIFGGSTKSATTLVLKSFYEAAFNRKMIEKLACIEIGASPDEIIRETDYSVGWLDSSARGKTLDDAKESKIHITALVYLKGRIALINNIIDADRLLQLQGNVNPRTGESIQNDSVEEISEENMETYIADRFDQLVEKPELYIDPGFYVCPIFYNDIELLRCKVDKDKDNYVSASIRMRSGFIYEIGMHMHNHIGDCKHELIDRHDIRFINARIAESQMEV